MDEVIECFICLQEVVRPRKCPVCSKLCCTECLVKWSEQKLSNGQQLSCAHCNSLVDLRSFAAIDGKEPIRLTTGDDNVALTTPATRNDYEDEEVDIEGLDYYNYDDSDYTYESDVDVENYEDDEGEEVDVEGHEEEYHSEGDENVDIEGDINENNSSIDDEDVFVDVEDNDEDSYVVIEHGEEESIVDVEDLVGDSEDLLEDPEGGDHFDDEGDDLGFGGSVEDHDDDDPEPECYDGMNDVEILSDDEDHYQYHDLDGSVEDDDEGRQISEPEFFNGVNDVEIPSDDEDIFRYHDLDGDNYSYDSDYENDDHDRYDNDAYENTSDG